MYMSSFFDYIISRYESKEKEEKNIKEKDNFTIKMILTALDVIFSILLYTSKIIVYEKCRYKLC